MKWASVDPAKGIAGIAWWNDDELAGTSCIKPRGTNGLFYVGYTVFESRIEAWKAALSGSEKVFLEKGAGGRANIIDAQGWIRGYIECLAEYQGSVTTTINVSEWRRCIAEAFKISWPKDRDRKKALAVTLVKDKKGISVTNDEADAVLIGVAALRMRMIS